MTRRQDHVVLLVVTVKREQQRLKHVTLVSTVLMWALDHWLTASLVNLVTIVSVQMQVMRPVYARQATIAQEVPSRTTYNQAAMLMQVSLSLATTHPRVLQSKLNALKDNTMVMRVVKAVTTAVLAISAISLELPRLQFKEMVDQSAHWATIVLLTTISSRWQMEALSNTE